MMKREQLFSYEAPSIEVIEVEVEKGFTISQPGGIGNGGPY